MKKSKKGTLTIWITSIVILLLLVNIGVTYYFYNIAYVRDETPVSQVKSTSKNYSLVTQFDKLEKENLTLNNDGLKLKAWYVPAEKKTNKTVIVVHGFRQNKEAMRQYAQLFHDLGYNVLMPDNRAAGESEGQLITYGYSDKKDIIAWAKRITQEKPQSNITLFGLSMGAATVMMASSQEDLPSSVNSIIEDCGYSDVWSEITYQAKSAYSIPPFPLVYSLSAMNKVRQGWFIKEASATQALSKDKLPILLIHGDADTYVPTSMIYDNFKAVKDGTPKEMLLVKGAAHAKSFETDPELYRRTVTTFMKKYNGL
ncbi:alpha/beta hydrolase [Lactococcus garvieae]|uniref:alpha/beta hydrolase n=1 Tax=Lactococcus garvieae TaxID=1363 RepID=UPI0009BD512E|nr:alpha/beta hydrolase [Lactococcus garvieae]